MPRRVSPRPDGTFGGWRGVIPVHIRSEAVQSWVCVVLAFVCDRWGNPIWALVVWACSQNRRIDVCLKKTSRGLQNCRIYVESNGDTPAVAHRSLMTSSENLDGPPLSRHDGPLSHARSLDRSKSNRGLQVLDGAFTTFTKRPSENDCDDKQACRWESKTRLTLAEQTAHIMEYP